MELAVVLESETLVKMEDWTEEWMWCDNFPLFP